MFHLIDQYKENKCIMIRLSLNSDWIGAKVPFFDLTPIAFIRLQTLTYSLNMPVFLGSINAELMPEYFHAAYIFGCKRNTAISANKPKYTFLLLTSVYQSGIYQLN